MRVEDIAHGSSTFKVGISEICNESKLSQDAFLDLARTLAPDVSACQFLDSTLIAGTGHLLSAAQNALNAQLGGYSIARSLDVEIILYASCQHQIGIALETFGVKDDLESVALVVVGNTEDIVRDRIASAISDIGHEISPPFAASGPRIDTIMTHFNIGKEEIDSIAISKEVTHRYDALARCVSSRVSMVALDS
jgi:tRNA threonylcarbamoyladenosine modification (KEOPS) complex Cgi121 subunit